MSINKVAVILSGCGYLDGAEIRESVLAILALDNVGVDYEIFAIDEEQHHVVNHLNGEEVEGESRNMLMESARIARGAIQELSTLDVDNFDALLIPGGFGVAKNLSSFAFKGSAGAVVEKVAEVISTFHAQQKPIGAICISPAIVALVLGDKNPVLTIGNDKATANELEKTGAKHQDCPSDSCLVDVENKIVTTPAYMDDNAKISDVYIGISKLVDELLRL